MKFILIIAWSLAPTAPPWSEGFKYEFDTQMGCQMAMKFAAGMIEKLPTKDGVKFILRCMPSEPPKAPEVDREI